MGRIQIAASSEIRAVGVRMKNSDENGWPELMIAGLTLEEILARADVVIQACEDIKQKAQQILKP